MAAPSDPFMIVAIEALRRAIDNLPLAIAMNLGRVFVPPGPAPSPPPPTPAGGSPVPDPMAPAPAPKPAPGAPTPGGAKPPPVPIPSIYDRPQAVIVVGPKPLPVKIEGAGAPAGAKGEPAAAGGGTAAVVQVLRSFVTTFAVMLGPVAVLSAIIGSELSGVRVLASALNLFASSVAPILMPVMFTLAVGLAAASDMIFSRLKPALENFFRVIIDNLLPSLQVLADMAAAVAQAFAWVAKNVGGKGSAQMIMPGLMGAGMGLMMALGGQSQESKDATDKSETDVKREMLFQMGSRGGVGTIRGNWAAAQAASTNMSPFQQKVLERFTECIAALERASTNRPSGAYGRNIGPGT